MAEIIRINTSSAGKLKEFQKFLGAKIEVVQKDLEEPESDPLTIIRYKASQFQNVLVDDTSLEIEGAHVGVKIKWLLEQLPEYEGKKASFICLLGIARRGKIHIYRGEVNGLVVKPRSTSGGDSFGFNPYFQPEGTTKTYAEDKPDTLNARFIAVQNFLSGKAYLVSDCLPHWKGAFQK